MKSKRKGSNYEREIAKKLSRWWDPSSKEIVFWRTHSSGAAKHLSSQQQGDIYSLQEDSKILIKNVLIECKHYKEFNLFKIITKGKIPLKEWIKKYQLESEVYKKKYFWIIFRLNHYPDMIFVNKRFFNKFKKYLKNLNHIQLTFEKGGVIFLLDEFLDVITPEVIKKEFGGSENV